MLYIVAGGVSEKRAALRHNFSRGSLEELDMAMLSIEELTSIAGTMTLTGESRAFFMRGVFSVNKSEEGSESKEALREGLLSVAEGLVESPHTFIIEEEKAPLKAVLEKLKKAGATVEILPVAEKKEQFNVFAIAHALEKQDHKHLWLLLMEALRQGIAPENIAGILSWKARTMLANAQEASRVRLEKLSRDLVVMYHDSHRGAGELGLLLERFVLTF